VRDLLAASLALMLQLVQLVQLVVGLPQALLLLGLLQQK